MKAKESTRRRHDFFTFANAAVQELLDDGRYGTSQAYAKSVASLRRFLQESATPAETTTTQDPAEVTLYVEDIDETLIYKYNRHLASRGVIRNSISFYNRTLRAIYNKALKRYRIPNREPFVESYTGIDKTRSRAISEKSIARLITLDLSSNKSLELTRDLFVFSYAMRGITYVDMAFLTRSNIHGSRIIYNRKKTGVRMEVRIEPQAKKIIDKYARKDSKYLLPILQDCRETDDKATMYRHYQAKLAVFNRNLKTLAQMIHEKSALTSYVSRHSWANAAYNTNVSMSVISEGLGHHSERTTRIYLGAMDARHIDTANRKLMERVLKFGSFRETNFAQIYV